MPRFESLTTGVLVIGAGAAGIRAALAASESGAEVTLVSEGAPTVLELIASHALQREESLGPHFRADHPLQLEAAAGSAPQTGSVTGRHLPHLVNPLFRKDRTLRDPPA